MTDPRYIKPLTTTLSDDERLWLVKLMEECAELQQAAAKVLRWGWNSRNPDAPRLGDNEAQLEREVRDVDEAVGKLYRLRPAPSPRLRGERDPVPTPDGAAVPTHRADE